MFDLAAIQVATYSTPPDTLGLYRDILYMYGGRTVLLILVSSQGSWYSTFGTVEGLHSPLLKYLMWQGIRIEDWFNRNSFYSSEESYV
jgi:hypothetical protein